MIFIVIAQGYFRTQGFLDENAAIPKQIQQSIHLPLYYKNS